MSKQEREFVGKAWNSSLNVYKYPGKKTKQTKIKPVSKSRVKKNAEYAKLRRVYLTANPVCKARLSGCTVEATDIHHMKGRGAYFLDLRFFLAVCRHCHNHIENNPLWAKENGFSVSRLHK